ncbi:retroviral-like aspartic protease family protein [Candidatus Roizmanbacteria bacterium]|nr:retroviral-like aspartic protease family protein [Candidatus Roizmanbacteria bacterium]
MRSTSFEFPYRFRPSGNNSRLAYPEIEVLLQTFRGKSTFNFIFDSGADITTLPFYMMKLLNIKKENTELSRSYGVGVEPIPSYNAEIPVKIGTLTFNLPVTFIPNKDVPLLLGKEGIFDRFNVTFDNDQEKTILTLRQVAKK